ncbi:CAAX amino terminal protease [Amycolatopsis mediterranei S699]|uniref:CAAX amino terminal protease family protein n=2 Tax=Amycolatopsis mediterranei TaxID=33910 RepID=A0A0H3CVI9_AMYMU|nr:CAAX amino terminal protease family protein [Amycolatopsis mediterranei U32]AEK38977.1 CAAX amino terminal protease [Amycolatopsis mediterranei S699]AGT81135.1 CAAX amino terminal protease [Amycolatopsis mediterranei RB]KDO09799.1 CAAX protease [Amycolatopsis mediterranei]AFO74006.1 CAAX amino terminal protease [Amycolatopsis mediterranei S699]
MVATRVEIGEERTDGGWRDGIRRRPLTWFFVLANLLSWLAWTPYILSGNGLGVLPFRFPEVLGTAQFAGVLPGAYLGPIGAAFFVTAVADGRTGLRRWTARLFKWRVSWLWYVGVVLSVPALLTIATVALSEQNPVLPAVATLVAYVPGLILQLLTTGLAEEPGWRDFALPRLQHRYGPLGGTLILGPLWGVWHLPLFFTEWGGWPDVTWLTPLEFIATCVTFSIIMTWVFNRTGQSLPLAMLLHTSVNNFFSLAWSEMFPGLSSRDTTHAFLLASTAVALVLLLATRGRLGYRRPELTA